MSALTVRFRERLRDAAVEAASLAEGFTPFQARILGGRLSQLDRPVAGLVQPRLSDLDTPHALPDIDAAARHIADAIQKGAPIAIVTDHDADGATSHAIIRMCLQKWGVGLDCVRGYISHRMREGYGISDAFVDRMLPNLAPSTCIITADQGSTDELRIARLREAGHDVIITDHHGVPDDGPPLSANAVVNPVRNDSLFPDRAIAGCHTALLVMAAVREVLIRRGVLAATSARASDFLDYCAVGTIADASSLGASHNNRIVVQRGLFHLNSNPRTCWRALRRVLDKEGPWTVADIAFQIATRINARGRLGDAMLSVEFLCESDEDAAYEMALELDANNRDRRTIERANTARAIKKAHQAIADGRFGLCLWLGEDGHAGVHGISASRIVEAFGRPTICLSPVAGTPDIATGSIRTTARLHVRNTLVEIQRRWPELLLSGGGHGGAGGLRVRRNDIARLEDAWDQCVRECYEHVCPGPEVLTDGDLDRPALSHIAQIAMLEPFGRGFESPVFFGEWRIQHLRSIGDGTHLKLVLCRGHDVYDAIWFGAKAADEAPSVQEGQSVKFAFMLDAQVFRGATRLQLIVRAIDIGLPCMLPDVVG